MVSDWPHGIETNMLADTAIRALKPAEKEYKKADSGGLHLLVKPSGSKL